MRGFPDGIELQPQLKTCKYSEPWLFSFGAAPPSDEVRLSSTVTDRDDAIKEQFYALHLRGKGQLDDAIENLERHPEK